MSGRLEQKPGVCIAHPLSILSSDCCQIVMKCWCVETVIEHEAQLSALLALRRIPSFLYPVVHECKCVL